MIIYQPIVFMNRFLINLHTFDTSETGSSGARHSVHASSLIVDYAVEKSGGCIAERISPP
jgi:hypothetical protein